MEAGFGSTFAHLYAESGPPRDPEDSVETLFLFCGELSKSLFEYRPGRETHRTGVGVEVNNVLSVPLGPVLDLPNTLPNNRISGSVSGSVSLVGGEQLMVHSTLRQSSPLVCPFDEIPQGLFAGVDARVAYDS